MDYIITALLILFIVGVSWLVARHITRILDEE